MSTYGKPQRQWYQRNKQKVNEYRRNIYAGGKVYGVDQKEFNRERQRKRILEKHRLTAEDFYQLLVNQSGKCKICQYEFMTRKDTCIDHDHTTNKVRGLLCHRCNKSLGLFEDNINLLVNGCKYLEQYQESE